MINLIKSLLNLDTKYLYLKARNARYYGLAGASFQYIRVEIRPSLHDDLTAILSSINNLEKITKEEYEEATKND